MDALSRLNRKLLPYLIVSALSFLVIDSWKSTLFIKRHGGRMDLGQRESHRQRARAGKSRRRGNCGQDAFYERRMNIQ